MWRIPLSDLNYDENEERAVVEVLRSRWLTMGPRTEEFESLIGDYLGVRHAIAVSNCTCALELAYEFAGQRASGRSQGAPRFLVPDITFVATANAAVKAGGTAAIIDIEGGDVPLMSRGQCSLALSDDPGCGCVVAIMHYAGFDCFSEEFGRLAASHGAVLVEDAAHAIGGHGVSGRALGTTGLLGCYSFFSNKNLATGEGGLVVTNDDEAARAVRLARSHGMTASTYDRHRDRRHGYDVLAAGHNYRCSELMAALAIVQLRKLDAGNARRRALYRLYGTLLQSVDGVRVVFSDDEAVVGRSACHILPLICDTTPRRDAIRLALDAAGIQTSHHYPALRTLTCYRGPGGGARTRPGSSSCSPAAACSVHYAARQITLPLYPGLRDADVEEICSIVRRAAVSETHA